MPENSAKRQPPAFLISAGFGLVGLVLLLLGAVSGAEALYLGGVAAGVISLIAALVWREELIMAWHATQKKRQSQE
ncbi:MAG: hypothetical protein M3Z84_07120 [Actinomycetota bacterium]|nr:hypothetical protein [Actinomycetota bacterium]